MKHAQNYESVVLVTMASLLECYTTMSLEARDGGLLRRHMEEKAGRPSVLPPPRHSKDLDCAAHAVWLIWARRGIDEKSTVNDAVMALVSEHYMDGQSPKELAQGGVNAWLRSYGWDNDTPGGWYDADYARPYDLVIQFLRNCRGQEDGLLRLKDWADLRVLQIQEAHSAHLIGH